MRISASWPSARIGILLRWGSSSYRNLTWWQFLLMSDNELQLEAQPRQINTTSTYIR